jgi:HEAT repeat protein
LKERGAAIVPDLAAWVRGLDPADVDVAHQRLEALWTYQALDVAEPALLAELLDAADPRVRAAATRVVPDWAARLSDPLRLLAARVGDDHPRVRLEAVRALARIPEVRSVEIALRALDRPTDRFLDYALVADGARAGTDLDPGGAGGAPRLRRRREATWSSR